VGLGEEEREEEQSRGFSDWVGRGLGLSKFQTSKI
jgi:hypothetical protein